MSRRSFEPIDCIKQLNTAKQGLQWKNRPFDKETILSTLKNCGLPNNNNFWRVFKNSGILQEVSKGQFMFTSKENIRFEKLVELKKKYQEINRIYKDNTTSRREQDIERTEELPENDPKAMTQFAIDLLKDQGYKIFAPVGMLYKQL